MSKTKRTPLRNRILPGYTRGEEIFNMVSHIVGGGFGIIALVACVVVAAIYNNVWGIVSGAIYGTSMITLYTMSSIYHGLTTDTSKKVFQIIDHCTIFLLIAGTYTPILLCSVREHSPAVGWVLFGIIWTAASIGIVFNAIDLKKYKVFSMIMYLVMGWCVIFAIKPVMEAFKNSPQLLWWILFGGISYTIGAVFYGFGKKLRYIHSVFHLFVLMGSILQFVGIILYVMPI